MEKYLKIIYDLGSHSSGYGTFYHVGYNALHCSKSQPTS
jgi:hypothetical protein